MEASSTSELCVGSFLNALKGFILSHIFTVVMRSSKRFFPY
jgi:hypothetical protein